MKKLDLNTPNLELTRILRHMYMYRVFGPYWALS